MKLLTLLVVSGVSAQIAGQQVSANPIITILAFLLMLFILVVVHELGHFAVARWFGIGVAEFGIGYPPRAFTLFERNGVKYTFNWLPLGGFVRFRDEENLIYGAGGTLAAAKPWKKIPVMVAGPLMNLLLAILIFAVMASTVGVRQPTGTVLINQVFPGSPAAQGGLRDGDELLSLNGQTITGRDDITNISQQNPGRPVTAVVRRDGAEQTLTITPGPWTTPDGEQRAVGLGISYGNRSQLLQASNPIEAVTLGSSQTWLLLQQMFVGLAQLPSAIGGLFTPMTASVEEPIGPVGLARATGEVINRDGGMLAFWNLTAILSLNLFLLNLLPIPALDGSHIVFSIIEWLRGGKKVPADKEALVHAMGFAALMGLMLLITVNDVIRAIQGTPVLGG
ncbi:MAG: M50 family metallopeptidase [Chloroflexaceae bacterium]|jgi:regulator of sigma E protease|nr:M50 family metallopeptidase [Chloroflexaceae bacterium]